jgi:hypothetical protein
VLNNVQPIDTPERFAFDDDERRAENASSDRVRDGVPQALLYLRALEASAELSAANPSGVIFLFEHDLLGNRFTFFRTML